MGQSLALTQALRAPHHAETQSGSAPVDGAWQTRPQTFERLRQRERVNVRRGNQAPVRGVPEFHESSPRLASREVKRRTAERSEEENSGGREEENSGDLGRTFWLLVLFGTFPLPLPSQSIFGRLFEPHGSRVHFVELTHNSIIVTMCTHQKFCI